MSLQVQPFSLYSSTPRTLAEYWFPLVRQIRGEGILLCDLTPIIQQCDPLTAQLLGHLFDWADKRVMNQEIVALRFATLPQWMVHLDLAIHFAKVVHKSLSPEDFVVSFADKSMGTELNMPAVLELIQQSKGDEDLPDRLSVSATFIEQVAAVAELLHNINTGGILTLESVLFSLSENTEFFFVIDALLSGSLDHSLERNRLLAGYRKNRVRQMEECFVVIGWVLESLRFNTPLRTRLWSLLGEPLDNVRGWY